MLSTFAYEAAGALDIRSSLRPPFWSGSSSCTARGDWVAGSADAWPPSGASVRFQHSQSLKSAPSAVNIVDRKEPVLRRGDVACLSQAPVIASDNIRRS